MIENIKRIEVTEEHRVLDGLCVKVEIGEFISKLQQLQNQGWKYVETDMSEFFTWVYENYTPCKGVEYQYGVPRANKSNQTIELDFAMATECHPKEWFEKPEVCKQWEI